MVEPASEIHGVADLTEKEQNLVRRPAHSEAAAHHQRRDGRVAAGLLCYRRTRRIHLKQRFDCTSWPIFFPNTIRYDTRCYFNMRSKADISQLNLPRGTDNQKVQKQKN